MMKPEELALLAEIVAKRRPALSPLIREARERRLTQEAREELREVLTNEFCERVLKPDDEPNSFGLAVDDLIGVLNPYID